MTPSCIGSPPSEGNGGMGETTIYHGTPMTPRAALLDVLPGRAAFVSFFRPDDVEAVEAVCPFHRVRQRRVLGMDGGHEARRGMVRPRRLDTVLSLAGSPTSQTGTLGRDTGCTGRAIPAQRRAAERLAVRSGAGRAAVAHGRADQSTGAAVREIRPRCPWLDRASEARACRLRRLSAKDGQGVGTVRRPLAPDPHDARREGGVRLSVRQRGQHVLGSERPSL